MSDKVKFVLTTSAEYFDTSSHVSQDEHKLLVREFFESDEITILAATKQDSKIQFHHRIPNDQHCLLFYKIPHVGNGQPSVNSLGLLTLEGGMVKSIYNSVARVFSPHVSKRSDYSPELTGLLENLHVSLGSTLGLPQTGIASVQDEINFWKAKMLNSPTKSGKEQAQTFISILEKINKQIRQIDQNSLNTVEEFLDSAHNNLDEIWRLPYHYPQNRMADLMDVICNQIVETCIENLMNEDVWNVSSYHINNLMNQVLDITESWMQLCDSLTRLFWPNYGQHPWIGKPHSPQQGHLFKERLSEIKGIKNLYKQIITLLDDHEIRNMLSWNSPFKSINVFDTTAVGQKKWNKALQQFEQLLQPIDERIALGIKYELHHHLNNPRQVIFIFSKYDTLIQRPMILELLTTEREQFLQSLQLLLQDLKKAMNDTNVEPHVGHLSTLCNECRWLKVVQHQLDEIEKVRHLIDGREGYEKVNETLQEMKEEVETLLKTNFEIWSEKCSSEIKSGELRLREDQPVVQFEKEGKQLMRVTFNPKLVTFCQDVREFENLGYRVPIELRSAATHATKFMGYARRLQQIATFHNTIGDRMIPCQRPIMLKSAIELSKLVQSESVAWNDEESVKNYVSKLQAAVNQLSNDNNMLAGYHEQAKRTVVKLMNTDLMSQGQVWKDEMRHLREIVATIQSKGFNNLDAFKLHWDHQLYKVLEYQYILGLIDMNNKLPDINIDIVFRQQQLQFRPTEEEIRLQYYSQLRRFIERPLGFRGLSDNSSELFKIMVERNRHHFGPLFDRAEELFNKLTELKMLWIPWIALGCVDIEQLCAVHLTKWEDWDESFKACKHFSQEVAKIQNTEETIDCFVVNILPLRTDIEAISRRYWEALSTSLKTSILNDVSIIQEYLHSSLQFLQNVPMDEAGIAESGAKYERIVAELPKITETLNLVKGKNTCLAGWCKERVSALSEILNQWNKLQPLIENHSVVLQRQVEIMRDHITTQLTNIKDEAEKFALRWESTIAELESNPDSTLELFQERQQHWKAILEKRGKLLLECEKFNTDFPADVKEVFDSIEAKLNTLGQQWEVYKTFLAELEEISKEDWAIYRRRPYIFTEFLNNWKTSVDSSLDTASSRIRKSVEQYQAALPVLQQLQSDSLTDRHWARVFQILNIEHKPAHMICLGDLLKQASGLIRNSDEIHNLVRQASSEQIVRQALNELDQWAVTATLKLTSHTNSAGVNVPLLKDTQEVLNKIGDNQSLLQSAKNSAAFDTFADQAEIWEHRLNSLDNILTSLSQAQRKWVYLEPVFGAGTLKNEEALFRRIDKDFQYIMREIYSDNRVLSVLKINNISSIIASLENQLSRCQNTLISYIMGKRNAFPRFYFIGDDDLLEILGQASKPEIIQKHISKLFPGIHSLVVEDSVNKLIITKACTAEGDSVYLAKPVEITGAIENWLNQLVQSIQETLKNEIINCSQIGELNNEALNKYPMQVICVARGIQFTKQTERAISSMSLSSALKSIRDEISKFASMKNQTQNSLLQIKLRGLLLDLVHYATILEHLVEANVTNASDWNWLQEIKFYLNKESKVVIKMGYAEFEYSYEFLGNPNKLVHTSLTHKCYLTLTQAMHLGLGGNPFGPAGTGKTECVKALGGMLGRLVLVFNCDENLDAEAMGLILTGLAQCGAWGCFDEFNRLQEATLSAISMLIQPIQTALKEKSKEVEILEKTVPLSQHCGIFVTLNPAGEEYGGRQQLPGNLQALFRPIVMQQPEPREILRVMLFVEGFKEADKIGNRIVELFDLIQKTLSAQKHYDWGLRELKTILLACGREIRENLGIQNETSEMKIAVRALKSNTMSKLNNSDSRRFNTLLENVFPEVTLDSSDISDFQTILEQSMSALGLQENRKQISKCLQLREQLTKRMGVVIVGPPSSGKSTLISILRHALITEGKTVRSYVISPKSMSRVQLLGKLDPDTRQWTDGVLTSVAATVSSEPANISSWIICDGDVDPEWIEALNSVLDDNKLLTLPSGWRIQFRDNVNFIFETHDLSHASPATISRMGIINLRIIVPSVCIVKSILASIRKCRSKDEFIVRLTKTLLSYIPIDMQNSFANEMLEMANIYVPNSSKAEFLYFNSPRDTVEIYETDYNNQTFGNGVHLILTGQAKAYLDSLRNFLEGSCNPFIIVGPSGSGKTILLQQASSELSGYQLIVVNCSRQLTPNYILHCLKQNCLLVSGLKGREYKPQQSRILLFLKNIDLLFVDKWGTSDVIELLLQLIQRNGFYSDSLEWINVSGLQVCASMTSNNSKQNLSPRYLSINSYLSVGYPSTEDMQIIVHNHLQVILERFKSSPKISTVVENLMQFFEELQLNFTVDKQVHYNFTPKMILNFIERLGNYPEEDFNDALITELRSMFRWRLSTVADLQLFDSILHNHFENFIRADSGEEYYLIPKSPDCSILKSVKEEEWRETIQKLCAICNTESFSINECITTELLQQIAVVSRSILRPGTSIVLVGQPGCRRTESLYLTAQLLACKIVLPQGIKNYSLADFYNDLKLAMQSAALDDQTTILLIDHYWLTFLPDILKPIEAILQGSEIIDLFGEDLESMASPLKSAAQLEGYQESLTSYFLRRAQKNLRLTLTLDSVNCNLQNLLSTYPSLYRNAEFIWMHRPPTDSLIATPKEWISFLNRSDQEIPISSYFMKFASTFQEYSPNKFYYALSTYFYIYVAFYDSTKNRLQKLKMGVEKLLSANKVVASLKEEATKQEVALGEKRKLANDALEMISMTMRNANDQKTDMLALQKKTQEGSEKLKDRQKAIEQELKEVEPVLREASAAVGQIKSEALSEIRSLRAPPEIIRDILEGVLRLMGTRDTSWNSMKSFLAKRGVKEDIRSLDPARITSENCEAVEKLLKAKAESFDVKNAKRASAAAAPLATWVVANVRYCRVIQSVEPLQREQNELQKGLTMAENQMKSLQSGLSDVDAKVKELSAKLNSYTQEAAVLEIKLEEARNTLKSAEVLVDKLSSEFSNWNKQLGEYEETYKTLDSKSFWIAISINFYSDLDYQDRSIKLTTMARQLGIETFNITKNLISEQEQIIWESMGLTRDVQAIENAALLTKLIELPFTSCPNPLLLDPSESAFKWLSEYLKTISKPFETISQNSEKLTYTLELAVRFGKIILIQDCAEIEPPLLQLLPGRVFSKFNKKIIQVGSKMVDLHENFKVIMFTKLNTLNIGSDISPYIAMVRFTITEAGLTDQLMSKTIQTKRPELEQKRINLLKNEGSLLVQKTQLEDKLLEVLSTSHGDILKNEKLLETLNEVKESSAHIDQSLIESENIKKTLQDDYNQYKGLCSKVSSFYIGISKSYDISITTFRNLFLKSLQYMLDNDDEEKIYSHLVKITYQYLARSISKSEHLALGLFICKTAFPDNISDTEWELFITNFTIGDYTSAISTPTWIKKELIPKILAFKSNLPEVFQNAQLEDENLWKRFADTNEKINIPVKMSGFQNILVTELFRPDLMYSEMNKVVSSMVGIRSGSFIQPTIDQLVEESTPNTPILLITEIGNDPSNEISDACLKKLGKGMYIELAIGKGMENKTMTQVSQASQTGKWICIKNVHLVPSWLTRLEREISTFDPNPNFKLWLICETNKSFPKSFESKCIKILYESPNGLKNKIRKLMLQWNHLITSRSRDPKLTKLFIIIFILNAILQERRNYIPQGWSKWYEFNDSDLRAGVEIFNWLFQTSTTSRIEWRILQGLFDNLVYGGKVNNQRDFEVLDAHLKEFFQDAVMSNRWSPLDLKVVIPTSTNIEDYYEAIEQISDVDNPEQFGLSALSNISRDMNACKNAIKTLRSAYFQNEDQQSLEKRIRPILNQWKKLAANATVLETSKRIDESKITNPWVDFVTSELQLGGKLHKVFKNT
ncbi:unnamed protein product [Hermetia illucens]|uniref:Dynein heavy chain, cytoplasmic n=1 Tax=Hermetia illucens TaxID=343691 RepID=A0A7R8YUF2_HERIL|nr:unnamed protein product [Hermetia illucens]